VTLDHTLSSDENRPGDHFEATVTEPVVIESKTVIPQGEAVARVVGSGALIGAIAAGGKGVLIRGPIGAGA